MKAFTVFIVVLAVLSVAMSAVAGELASEAAYNAAIAKATAEFETKKKMALETYAKALKAEQVALTQKGDLDGALEARDKMSNVEAELAALSQANPFVLGAAGTPPQFTKPLLKGQRADGGWDLDVMGPEEWASIKAPEFRVEASKEFDTGITLSESIKYQIVPHPSDKWCYNSKDEMFSWRGREGTQGSLVSSALGGTLIQSIALPSGIKKYYTIDKPQKEGRLSLTINMVYRTRMTDNVGFIRVKIVKLK